MIHLNSQQWNTSKCFDVDYLGRQIARASTADIALHLDALFETIENQSQEPKQRLGVIALRLDRKTIRTMNTIVLRRRKAGGKV